ncbi:MAG: SAM-dependent methyltransferase, partial [Clostridia bacterium]|nr:SAM-dependent methyltransferase [Clostridia bacterium]
PPSFGRGPNNETWKLEDDLFDFVTLTKKVLSEKPVLVLINSYTTGLQPTVMSNILNTVFTQNGKTESYELCIPTEEKNIFLPCGCSAVKYFD